jgi:hypothetical protein
MTLHSLSSMGDAPMPPFCRDTYLVSRRYYHLYLDMYHKTKVKVCVMCMIWVVTASSQKIKLCDRSIRILTKTK